MPRRFYARDPVEVAGDLVGRVLVREVDGERLVGRVVEAEAYAADDPASHTFRGRTPRNATMFGPPGYAYVYISHGIHHCLNLTTGNAAAVLVRALEPLEGLGGMARRRGTNEPRLLCAGPGRLCQAMGITLAENGSDLVRRGGLWLAPGEPADAIVSTPRVGLSVAMDVPWRFVERGTGFASRSVRAVSEPPRS